LREKNFCLWATSILDDYSYICLMYENSHTIFTLGPTKKKLQTKITSNNSFWNMLFSIIKRKGKIDIFKNVWSTWILYIKITNNLFFFFNTIWGFKKQFFFYYLYHKFLFSLAEFEAPFKKILILFLFTPLFLISKSFKIWTDNQIPKICLFFFVLWFLTWKAKFYTFMKLKKKRQIQTELQTTFVQPVQKYIFFQEKLHSKQT